MTRQDWLFIALGALALSSLLGSVGAWLLLWRDHRERKGSGLHRGRWQRGSRPL